MSLLNRPSDGMHSVLVVVFKLLLTERAIERERLLALCTPAGGGDPKQVTMVLNTWIRLGLLEEHPDKGISLHADVRRDERKVEVLPQLTRRLVLRKENNPNLWAVENSKAADFTRAVCWLLAQDSYRVAFTGWDEVERMLRHQFSREVLGDDDENLRFIANRERWTPLKAWCVWFGFAWNGSYPNKVLVMDPTTVIRDTLPAVISRSRVAVPAQKVIASLAEQVPVLDGGTHRLEIEGRMREQAGPDAWVPPPNDQMSTTLSRALLRLHREGTLVGMEKADSPEPRIHLTGQNQKVLQTFSHFEYHPLGAS